MKKYVTKITKQIQNSVKCSTVGEISQILSIEFLAFLGLIRQICQEKAIGFDHAKMSISLSCFKNFTFQTHLNVSENLR